MVSLIAVLLALPACYRSPDREMDTIVDYIAAVQGQDMAWLYQLRSGIEPPSGVRPGLPRVRHIWEVEPPLTPDHQGFNLFAARAAARYRYYESARLNGEVDFTPLGIVLIKTLVLGRGVMYEAVDRRRDADGRVIVTLHVNLAYDRINYSQLPDGTIVFFMSYPLGRIYQGVVGERVHGAVQLLDSLRVRCDLVPGGAASPHGWRLVSFMPLAETAETITVTGLLGNRSWQKE